MKTRRPSVSLGVAVIALVVAMSGTAFAATMITTNQIKDGTILPKDLSVKARNYLRGQRGPKGATGATGAPGVNGNDGTNGSSGVVSIKTVGGPVSNTTLSGALQYLGPTTSVTVAAGQKVVGSVAASLASSGSSTLSLSLCEDTGGTLSRFVGATTFSVFTVDATKRSYTAANAATLSAGTYTVGLCGGGSGTLDTNDWAIGWFMVASSS